MKQVNTLISTYTADVSAVCSALYELGGMVVIHDPSGCNSTYNTHDEPRWYEQDSLIFISGLSEIDAIMGNDDKLIRDVLTAARVYHPEFIVLLQSPVPLLMGTDFSAIARKIGEEADLPVYFIPTTGMNSYIWGAGEAFSLLAREFVKTPEETKERTGLTRVNLLGVTPLDFSVNTTVESFKEEITGQGFEIQSTWAMGSDLFKIREAARADLNIVAAASGLKAAKVMEERFGIPYIAGVPVGNFASSFFDEARECIKTKKSAYPYKKVSQKPEKDFIFIGEPVMGQSLAAAFALSGAKPPVTVTMQEVPEELLGEGCLVVPSEEELKEVMREAATVIADPLFLSVCPKDVSFIPFPQEACSGRMYRKQIPDVIRDFDRIFSAVL